MKISLIKEFSKDLHSRKCTKHTRDPTTELQLKVTLGNGPARRLTLQMKKIRPEIIRSNTPQARILFLSGGLFWEICKFSNEIKSGFPRHRAMASQDRSCSQDQILH